jgi:uncharacterized protein (DUF427 family)
MAPSTTAEPGPGRESVWDYPRPPRLERSSENVRVELGGVVVARTDAALRVLETSHPPVYYLPADCFVGDSLSATTRATWCEFKGRAVYWDLSAGGLTAAHAAWSYPRPAPGYEALVGHLAVYPSRVDGCWVGAQRVSAQEGDFYGGWITADIVGPFKGAPGTRGW